MKYILFDKDNCKWQMVYCTDDMDQDLLLQNISKAMLMDNDFMPFHTKEHCCVNGEDIKNDDKLFSLSENGVRYLWQLGSRVSDMTGIIIPHTHYVRIIGKMIPET